MSRSVTLGVLLSLALTAVASPSQAQRWQYRRCRHDARDQEQACVAQCPESRRNPGQPSGRCMRECEDQRQQAENTCEQYRQE